MFNMNSIVHTHDIVLITLDTLRFDVAQRELERGNLPTLSKYIDTWEKRHSPGSFTYASHHAIFAGFFPTPIDDPLAPRLMAVDFLGSTSTNENTFTFKTSTIVEGLSKEEYHTICIGGVGFFNKQNPLGCTLPSYFDTSIWTPELGVTCKDSTKNQIDESITIINSLPEDKRVFLFINISALHQPNYFYDHTKSDKKDTLETHSAALRYVDSQLESLFSFFQSRNDTLFILCSDHGTCYGEDGFTGHRLAHEVVWNVPYCNFIQEKNS